MLDTKAQFATSAGYVKVCSFWQLLNDIKIHRVDQRLLQVVTQDMGNEYELARHRYTTSNKSVERFIVTLSTTKGRFIKTYKAHNV